MGGSASAKNKRPSKKARNNRAGYSSVARTRGAAVTGEMKYFDTAVNATALAASTDWTGTEFDPATFNTLCVPQVGAGINQRIGKAIKVLKLKIDGNITVPSAAFGVEDAIVVRLLLVQDQQTNSAQAQGEQVMTSGAVSALLAVNQFQNIDNFGRFRVLKDKKFIVQNPNALGLNHAGLSHSFKMTCLFKKPVQVRFNATNGGTVADIVDNSFHIMCNVSDNDLAPNITYVSRVCYKE